MVFSWGADHHQLISPELGVIVKISLQILCALGHIGLGVLCWKRNVSVGAVLTGLFLGVNYTFHGRKSVFWERPPCDQKHWPTGAIRAQLPCGIGLTEICNGAKTVLLLKSDSTTQKSSLSEVTAKQGHQSKTEMPGR